MTVEDIEKIKKFTHEYGEKVKHWVANKENYVFEKIIYTVQDNIKVGVNDENEQLIKLIVND